MVQALEVLINILPLEIWNSSALIVFKNLIQVKGPQNAGVLQICGAGLFQTAITSVKNTQFKKK